MNGISETAGLVEVGLGGFAPDQIGVGRVGQTSGNGGVDSSTNAEEPFRSTFAGAECAIARINIAGEKVRAVRVGAGHNQRGHAEHVSSETG